MKNAEGKVPIMGKTCQKTLVNENQSIPKNTPVAENLCSSLFPPEGITRLIEG